MSLLLPVEFRDTDIRRAPWVGEDFSMPLSQFRAEYGIPEDVDIPTGGEKPYFGADDSRERDGDPEVTGVYLEYRAMLFGKSTHPKAVWCLVLVDGMDQPIKHGPSQHQTIGEDGRLTPDSLPDYTILPLWIRDLPDSAWVPSDSTITAPLTKEINKYRTQSIEQRESARSVILYDPSLITPETKQKIEQGEINTMVPVTPGALAQGPQAIMAQVATASQGRESYLGQDYIQQDRERVLGISANQTGSNGSQHRQPQHGSPLQSGAGPRHGVVHGRGPRAGCARAAIRRRALRLDARWAAQGSGVGAVQTGACRRLPLRSQRR
jgi:hypothetical protein